MASAERIARSAHAERLRTEGLTYKEIGEAMGISLSNAHRLVSDPLDEKRNEYRRGPQRTECERCGGLIQQPKGRGGRKHFCAECVVLNHRDQNRIRWQTSKHAHNERRRVINLTPERVTAKRERARADYIRQGDRTPLEAIRIFFCDPCSYCGGSADLGVDHIIPIADGGDGGWDNLTSCCLPCNIAKKDRPLLRFLARRLELHG